MNTKLYKSYKFHFDIVFGMCLGALTFILIAAYEYYSYKNLGASANGFFGSSVFSAIFFPCMLVGFFQDKKKYLIANGITRKNIYISQVLSMLSLLPVIAVMIVVVEKIYYKADKYKPKITKIFSRYFNANDISQWETIALTILWAFGSIIVIFAVVYMFSEIISRLGRVGKIIFIVSAWVVFVGILIAVVLLYKSCGSFIRDVFGFAGNPIHSTITKLIIAIPLFISSYMLARRSPMKTK